LTHEELYEDFLTSACLALSIGITQNTYAYEETNYNIKSYEIGFIYNFDENGYDEYI
jgi:hypothetical protein